MDLWKSWRLELIQKVPLYWRCRLLPTWSLLHIGLDMREMARLVHIRHLGRMWGALCQMVDHLCEWWLCWQVWQQPFLLQLPSTWKPCQALCCNPPISVSIYVITKPIVLFPVSHSLVTGCFIIAGLSQSTAMWLWIGKIWGRKWLMLRVCAPPLSSVKNWVCFVIYLLSILANNCWRSENTAGDKDQHQYFKNHPFK